MRRCGRPHNDRNGSTQNTSIHSLSVSNTIVRQTSCSFVGTVIRMRHDHDIVKIFISQLQSRILCGYPLHQAPIRYGNTCQIPAVLYLAPARLRGGRKHFKISRRFDPAHAHRLPYISHPAAAYSAFVTATFNMFSIPVRAYFGSFAIDCHISPCFGSAKMTLLMTSAFFSSLPCCKRNL